MLFSACTVLTGDLGRIVAIEIDGPSSRELEEEETHILTARAIDAGGDSVPEAMVVWELLEPDSGETDVGFELDTITGAVLAVAPGNGRVRARVDGLRSDTISLVVTGAPDSIAASGDTSITMASSVDVSSSLRASLVDLTTDPAASQPLAGKTVTFMLTDPPPGSAAVSGLFLTVESDSVPDEDPHVATASTSSAGVAAIVIRRITGGALPDTAIVEAVAVTAIGDTVAGSPVRFVIAFDGVP